MNISIFIRTHNEEKALLRTLKAIQDQSLQPDEVIILDNESTDKTQEVAKASGAKVEKISRAEFSYGRALNLALAFTQGDIIVFLSAHSPPVTRDWLKNMVCPITEGKAGVTFGRQIPEPSVNALEEWFLYRTFPRRPNALMKFLGFQKITFSNGNAAISRSLLKEEAFREDLTFGEDIEWSCRVSAKGFTVQYCPEAAVYHSHFFAPGDLEKRMINVGEAMAQQDMGRIYKNQFSCFAVHTATIFIDLFYCVARGYWGEIKKILGYRLEYFRGLRQGMLKFCLVKEADP